jgi:hypothetical protein
MLWRYPSATTGIRRSAIACLAVVALKSDTVPSASSIETSRGVSTLLDNQDLHLLTKESHKATHSQEEKDEEARMLSLASAGQCTRHTFELGMQHRDAR